MLSLTGVNGYLCANVLMIVAALLISAIRAVNGKLAEPLTQRHLLRVAYAITAAVVLLPLFGGLWGQENLLPHSAQVWSGASMQAQTLHAPSDHRVIMSLAPAHTSISMSIAARIAGYLFLSGLFMVLVRVVLDAWAIARILSYSQVLRRRARLRILVSETIAAPFSFWIPGRYYIAAPAALIWQPQHLRLVIRHEAQHHRQADTKVLYLCQLLRGLFYWNPAAHALTRQVLELQEFACDEAVIARGQTSAHDYCRCLLAVAETITQRRDGVLRAGMVTRNRGSLLRRIETALAPPRAQVRKTKAALTAAFAITLLAAFAITFAKPIQDRRISRDEAERMMLVAQQSSAFPITMNDRVLEQLNILLGTPDGRAYLKAGVARMEQYKPLIAGEIERNGLPAELIAVPLVESGYRNLPADEFPRHGAGLWMFIEPTAKRFGLEVTDNKDERLDVPSETAAALRMLSSLHQRFDDWSLALLAYNIGDARIEQGIRETASRDAWELIRRGYENDPDYLSRSIAVMLILKNPDVL